MPILSGGSCAVRAALYQHGFQHGLSRFRRFAGHGGAERVIDEVAFALGKDPLEIRKRNFYDEMGKDGTRNVTPYHQKVEDCIIQRIVAQLEESADYAKRREAIREFNAKAAM